MTTEDYKAAGYRVSGQVSQQEIDRAEKEVTEAYIAKVAPSFDSTDADVKAAVMQLAAILLLRRAAVVTRSGGKVKMSPSLSEAGYPNQADVENADRLLRKVQTEKGVTSKLVDDIAGIYFRTQFVSL
jgi:hypothetical protein